MFAVSEDSSECSYTDVSTHGLHNNPYCSHGPTLLFSRKTKKGDRKYYACSACRDRKLCQFFQWADEKISGKRQEIWDMERKNFIGEKTHEEMYSTLCSLRPLLSKKQVAYCHTCSEFMLCHRANQHSSHDVILDVSLNQIMHPTELLKPLEHNKKEAQYLFSKASVRALINVALENKIKSVVCIGTPRIHEYIKTTELNMNSILLDMDKRYHMFYKADSFCWFNSFNYHFFFGKESKQSFENFLLCDGGKGILLILDPPFGGRLEPLAYTLKCIETLHRQLNPHSTSDLSVILIFPYFMEQHVLTCLPSFNMIDYKVTYDNHSLFSQGTKARKLGSPVRIFTNICPEKVILPKAEGYKFCKICCCWVSPENKHCTLCNKCTSKNGSTYVHCTKCKKCVKPTWKHCKSCNQCCLESHTCAFSTTFLKCYHCGQEGHTKHACMNLKDMCVKMSEAPIVNISNNNHKRKRETCKTKHKKKKLANNK